MENTLINEELLFEVVNPINDFNYKIKSFHIKEFEEIRLEIIYSKNNEEIITSFYFNGDDYLKIKNSF